MRQPRFRSFVRDAELGLVLAQHIQHAKASFAGRIPTQDAMFFLQGGLTTVSLCDDGTCRWCNAVEKRLRGVEARYRAQRILGR